MIEIKGKYNTAICYCDELEKSAAGQIKTLCDWEFFADSKIRIMPDVHAGLGCTIGTTMTITDKVVPGMVGVDIGCGMETVRIDEKEMDLQRLDRLIYDRIPCGRDVRRDHHPLNGEIDLTELRCAGKMNLERARRSIGTLGGGNHFIEVARGNGGELYVVVHSGSRHLGNEVARYYQEEAFRALCGSERHQIDEAIARLRAKGKSKKIEKTIRQIKKKRAKATSIPKDLAYVEGEMFEDYIHDMKMIQRYAVLNRKAMMDVIIEGMNLTPLEDFTTIHNYIDMEKMILRKGAVSAAKGEKLLIPINMRDGSLICVGKGNEDWNSSAPHGAGRLMSRREAFASLSMEEYKEEMKDIYTSCVKRATLDEAPMAYKSIHTILEQITPTADVIDHIKPIYNFKAAE